MKRKVLIIIAAFLGLLILICAGSLGILRIRTDMIRDDNSSLRYEEKYRLAVRVDGVEVIVQDVSCGYAVIEMFSHWNGGHLAEEDLFADYGKVVTSTGRAFCAEMNKRFPGYATTMCRYLKNSELIDTIYDCLAGGIPVPVEWAALYGDVWTLHYSLIIGMDIPNDVITVANPYGYVEEVSVDDFLNRTSFEAYRHMPLFLKLGFAFGFFEKNTVYAVRRAVDSAPV